MGVDFGTSSANGKADDSMNGSWFHSAKRSSPSCNVLKTVILSDE